MQFDRFFRANGANHRPHTAAHVFHGGRKERVRFFLVGGN